MLAAPLCLSERRNASRVCYHLAVRFKLLTNPQGTGSRIRPWQVLGALALVLGVAAVGLLLRGGDTAPGVVQTREVGGATITVRLDEAAVGTRVVEVTARDGSGRPVPLTSVRLHFSMAEMDMGDVSAEAERVGDGRFRARGPFFSMAGLWTVDATLEAAGGAPLRTSFAFPIAAPGEASGPVNPLPADERTRTAGQRLYTQNCLTCHGAGGRGDGPAAAGLQPRPADFTQHMAPGLHTDGQVFLWIKEGYPGGGAMPAWGGRLSDEQIWQLVTYLRTFGGQAPGTIAEQRPTAPPGPTPPAVGEQPPPSATPQPIRDVAEPLPPLVFARQQNIWRSVDGEPRRLTQVRSDGYAQYPTLSPDGRQIAYTVIAPPAPDAETPLPTSELRVIAVDGSGDRVVWKPEQGILSLPTWTPDGAGLYVAISGGPPIPGAGTGGDALQVVRVGLADGAVEPLLENALDPTLSPDGAQLAFLRLAEDGLTMSLYVAKADGSDPRVVIDGSVFLSFYAPRFSPDGRQIVVAAVGGPETDDSGVPIQGGGPSPLDGLLGLLEPPAAKAHGQPWDLWLVDVDGGGLRRLTWMSEDLPMAVFSPDGTRIAILGFGGLYLMNADGTDLRRIDREGDHGGLDWEG